MAGTFLALSPSGRRAVVALLGPTSLKFPVSLKLDKLDKELVLLVFNDDC